MADIVKFTCPRCDQKYRAPSRLAGRSRTCVKCGAHFDIPSASSPSRREPARVQVAQVAVATPVAQVAQVAEVVAQTRQEEVQAPPARIPPAGPVSEFAAALSESSAVIDPQPVAMQFVAEPEPLPQAPAPQKQSYEPPVQTPVPIPVKTPQALPLDGKVFAEALAKAELAAADSRARADRAAADARAKANEVAAVAQRNEERKAAIYRQIEMQAESDYRQVLLRAADSLTAAEKAAVSDCRFYSEIYHAAERLGIDPAMAVTETGEKARLSNNGSKKDTLSVMKHVMELISEPPTRFKRANEKLAETFDAYAQLDALAMTPSANKAAREAALADLHNKFAASMSEMRALIRTSE